MGLSLTKDLQLNIFQVELQTAAFVLVMLSRMGLLHQHLNLRPSIQLLHLQQQQQQKQQQQQQQQQ